MAIKKGDKVKVDYTGTLDDGSVFDDSKKHGQPLEFEVGSGQVIKGFDDALMGMNVGDEKDITIESKDAYGDPREDLVKKVPRDQFPKDQQLEKGMILVMQLQDGMQLPATVVDVSDSEVTIDLNHPLAGKTLHFKLTVVTINEEAKK
ncbi:MAG: peptidylprolyl isomerase [Candidatus Woesearchaeota archaeon]|nr:MAG: peptidylprolyl isomerase [Candidatus Woesearchaeota archaeon]